MNHADLERIEKRAAENAANPERERRTDARRRELRELGSVELWMRAQRAGCTTPDAHSALVLGWGGPDAQRRVRERQISALAKHEVAQEMTVEALERDVPACTCGGKICEGRLTFHCDGCGRDVPCFCADCGGCCVHPLRISGGIDVDVFIHGSELTIRDGVSGSTVLLDLDPMALRALAAAARSIADNYASARSSRARGSR